MIYSDFIKGCLEESSKISLAYFGKVKGTIKPEDSNQVLTDADLAIGKMLIDKIEKEFPDHNIIDEEAGVINKNSEYTWVNDPIDGTSNFAMGVPTYGTMIGLLKNDVPIAGGIILPFFKDIYWAEKGLGAFRDGQKITVTTETDLLKSLVVYQIDSHRENPPQTMKETEILGKVILKCRNFRHSGSPLDLVNVANGKYGGMLNQTSNIWDNVAQQIIAEEAGALYTDFWGKPIDYSDPLTRAKQNFTYCTASPILHEQLQKIINS